MAFQTPPLPVLLAVNALLGALFIYGAYEAYQLSKQDWDGATHFRSPWLERLVQVFTTISLLLLVVIALILAHRYHYGA